MHISLHLRQIFSLHLRKSSLYICAKSRVNLGMHCPATPTHLPFTSAFSDFWLSGPTCARIWVWTAALVCGRALFSWPSCLLDSRPSVRYLKEPLVKFQCSTRPTVQEFHGPVIAHTRSAPRCITHEYHYDAIKRWLSWTSATLELDQAFFQITNGWSRG